MGKITNWARERFLSHEQDTPENVTALLFVGTRRRWQLTFPRFYVKTAVVILAVMAIWGGISFTVAASLHSENTATVAKIQNIRQQIFNYEVEHEGLFERTYEKLEPGPNVAGQPEVPHSAM